MCVYVRFVSIMCMCVRAFLNAHDVRLCIDLYVWVRVYVCVSFESRFVYVMTDYGLRRQISHILYILLYVSTVHGRSIHYVHSLVWFTPQPTLSLHCRTDLWLGCCYILAGTKTGTRLDLNLPIHKVYLIGKLHASGFLTTKTAMK